MAKSKVRPRDAAAEGVEPEAPLVEPVPADEADDDVEPKRVTRAGVITAERTRESDPTPAAEAEAEAPPAGASGTYSKPCGCSSPFFQR